MHVHLRACLGCPTSEDSSCWRMWSVAAKNICRSSTVARARSACAAVDSAKYLRFGVIPTCTHSHLHPLPLAPIPTCAQPRFRPTPLAPIPACAHSHLPKVGSAGYPRAALAKWDQPTALAKWDQRATLGRPLLSGISPLLSLIGIGRLPLGGSMREREPLGCELSGTALSGTTVVRLVSLQMS